MADTSFPDVEAAFAIAENPQGMSLSGGFRCCRT